MPPRPTCCGGSDTRGSFPADGPQVTSGRKDKEVIGPQSGGLIEPAGRRHDTHLVFSVPAGYSHSPWSFLPVRFTVLVDSGHLEPGGLNLGIVGCVCLDLPVSIWHRTGDLHCGQVGVCLTVCTHRASVW